MAYIRKLPSGRFQATVRHPSGRKVTKTDPLKRVVQAWANETEAAYRNGEVASERGRGVTVQQWHDRWAPARNVERTTAHQQRLRMDKHILPTWGSWPLRSIDRIDVQKWVTELGRAHGPHVVVSAYALFAKMLSDAELDGLIPATPCRKITLPRVEKPTPRWLSRDEYDRLMLAFAGMEHGRRWQAYLAVACYSGLRSGELAGLDVGAVDFDRGVIHVGQVMTKFGLRAYGKTDKSRRTVPLHPEAAALLWPEVADKPGDAPAFPAPRGGRIEQGNWLKWVWHPALKAAGIAPVRQYVTRHTAASWLVQAGVPLWDIAQLLGHSTTDMVKVYAHLAPGAHESVRAVWSKAAGARVAHDGLAVTPPDHSAAGQSAEQ